MTICDSSVYCSLWAFQQLHSRPVVFNVSTVVVHRVLYDIVITSLGKRALIV